jgi:hypothetical protein
MNVVDIYTDGNFRKRGRKKITQTETGCERETDGQAYKNREKFVYTEVFTKVRIYRETERFIDKQIYVSRERGRRDR